MAAEQLLPPGKLEIISVIWTPPSARRNWTGRRSSATSLRLSTSRAELSPVIVAEQLLHPCGEASPPPRRACS